MMRTIESFVRRVVTATPGESLVEVARLMECHNVGTVVLVEGHRPVGILTDRDLALALGARGRPPHTPASAAMTTPVEVVPSDAGVFDVTDAMRELGVRRLPVVDEDGLLVGIVSLDDLLRLLSRELVNVVDGIRSEMDVK